MNKLKPLALPFSIVMLCFNITPVAGEFISSSHHRMSNVFLVYMDNPVILGFAGMSALGVAFVAIRSRINKERLDDSQLSPDSRGKII